MAAGLHRIALSCLFALIAAVSAASAQEEVERERERGPAVERRNGGIPRAQVLPEDEGSEEGTEDGVPRLQTAPAEREGEASPYLLPPDERRWKLGIYASNTDTGVVVRRVLRGTAGSRIGLESGDRIVTVDGFQVGWVEDRLYPLGHELQRQAGRRGRVTLLIQNVRTSRLLNRDVQLDTAARRRR